MTAGWGTDKPTVEGWYWMRAPKHGWRDCVMWVDKDDDGFYIDVGDCDSEYVTEIEAEWLGPITPDAYAAGRRAGETIETVTAWADQTFGPATLDRQIKRAKEELAELEAAAETANYLKIAEEAADVCICLFRVIGSIDPEALNRKMAINRERQWKVDGDGCAYHVKIEAQGGEK